MTINDLQKDGFKILRQENITGQFTDLLILSNYSRDHGRKFLAWGKQGHFVEPVRIGKWTGLA